MDQQVTTTASAAGPPWGGTPAVHALRFGVDPDDPSAVRVLERPSSLPEGTARVVARLAASAAGGHLDAPAVAFSHLPDGGSVLYRARASGAFEFEAEVVLYPQDAPRDGWLPINAWPEAAWPPRGPGAAGFRPVPWAARADLVAFARRMAARLPVVLADVRSLFARAAGPQIFLVDEPEDVARWIMLASVSLPAAQARALTFTTFAGLPHAVGQQIAGVSPTAVDRLCDEEVEFLYRVRGGNGRTSPDLSDPWARVAAALWIADRPELIVDGVGRPAAGVGFDREPDTADRAGLSQPLPSEGSRIPADEPFDAGRLATVAMLAGVDLDPDLRILAVTWLSHYASTSAMEQTAVSALLHRLPPIAKDVVSAAQPDRKALRFLGEAFRSLKRRDRQTARPIAAQLGAVVVEAALADVAGIGADPLAELELTNAERHDLSAAYAGRIQTLFDDADERFPPRPLYGGIVLARALGIDATPGLDRLSRALCALLLAPQPGADRGEVLAYLDGTGDQELTERVVAHLEKQLHHRGDVDRFRDLAMHESGGWLRRQDLGSAPALQLLLAAMSPSMRTLSGMDRFTELFRQTNRREVRMLRIMGDLSWQVAGELSVADALRLGAVLGTSELLDAGFDGRLSGAFDPTRCGGPTEVKELTELARLLRRHGFRPPPGTEAIAELLIAADALQDRNARLDGALPVMTRMASLDLPTPIRDRTARLAAGLFARAEGQDLLRPTAADAFLDQGSGAFLQAYVDRHRGQWTPMIRRLIRDDAENAAGRYHLWRRMEISDHPDLRRHGTDLIGDFIIPARREATKRWENAVYKALKRDHPHTADRWDRAGSGSEPPAPRDEHPPRQPMTGQQAAHRQHDASPDHRSDPTQPGTHRGPARAEED